MTGGRMKADEVPGADWDIEYPRAIYFLNEANQGARNLLEQGLSALEITGIQYTVLTVIGRADGISSADLSRRFYVTPQAMNELTGLLLARELIARKVSSANRRILSMTLTAKGRALVQKCNTVADRVEREVFAALSADEYGALRRLVRSVAGNLKARRS